MRAGAEHGPEKVTLPSRRVGKPPRGILKFVLSTIVLINLAQFPSEGAKIHTVFGGFCFFSDQNPFVTVG